LYDDQKLRKILGSKQVPLLPAPKGLRLSLLIADQEFPVSGPVELDIDVPDDIVSMEVVNGSLVITRNINGTTELMTLLDDFLWPFEKVMMTYSALERTK
jgi:hypothetical protein